MTTPAVGQSKPGTPQQVSPPRAARSGFLSPQVRATLAAAAVVAMLGMASLPWLMGSPTRVSKLIATAVPSLQASVRFGSVKLGWLGPLVFEDIHIVPHDGSREPVTISRIEVSHGLAGILMSLGDLGRLRVEGLDATVVFDAQRNSNLKGLFLPAVKSPADLADPAAPGRPRQARLSPVRLQLEVANAIVRIVGPWADDPWVSDPIHVRATLAPAAAGPWSEWTLEPVQLLADARLEPGVAQGVLAYIAPVLADATRTGGRFSLRLNAATLPVGAADGGHLSGVLSMHAVDLGPGPLVAHVIEALPGRFQPPSSIRIADQSHVEFHVADRRVWHTGLAFGVPLVKLGERLDIRSSGSVGIDDKSLDLKLELPIPANLPQDRPLLAALAGQTFSVGIGGELGNPRVNFDGTLRATAGNVVSELVNRLRGAGGPSAARTPPAVPIQPSQPPGPAWRPNGAGNVSQGDSPPAKAVEGGSRAANPEAGSAAGGSPAQAGGEQDATTPGKLDGIKLKLPAEITADTTTESVIDLVGGLLGEVAKRRAERQAAEAANPQQAVPQPRRGRLLRRLMPPPAPALSESPPLTPVPPPALGQPPAASAPAEKIPVAGQ